MSHAHAAARNVLAERRQALEAVTRRLLEKEVIEGEELRQLMAASDPPAAPL